MEELVSGEGRRTEQYGGSKVDMVGQEGEWRKTEPNAS
jgi:hypothetical protein